MKGISVLAALLFLLFASSTTHSQSALNVSPTANWNAVGAILAPQTVGSTRINYADAAIIGPTNGTYRMYYSNFTEPANQYNTQQGVSGAIDSATSTDLVHWTIDPGARITDPTGACPPFEGSSILMPNNTVRIYASCGVFASADGLTFTRLPEPFMMPQIPGATAGAGLQIMRLPDGTYKMYAGAVFNGTDPRYAYARIYSYTSTDGFNFVQDPGVRVGGSAVAQGIRVTDRGHPLVYMLANGTWMMLYDTFSGTKMSASSGPGGMLNSPTAVAVSKDGLNWTTVAVTANATSSEAYAVAADSNGTGVMIFGYYGTPGFALPSYASSYGGGIYYATQTSYAPAQATTTGLSTTTVPQAQTTATTVPQTSSSNAGNDPIIIGIAALVVIVVAAAYLFAKRKR